MKRAARVGGGVLTASAACLLLWQAPTAAAEEPPAGGGLVTQKVVTTSPFPTGPVDGALPPPPSTGLAFPNAPIGVKDSKSVHEGRMTWGPDLLASPVTGQAAWKATFFPSPATAHTAAPAFALRTAEALASAAGHLGSFDTGLVGKAFELFADLAEYQPGAEVDVFPPASPPAPVFRGFQPLRARWLRSQWGRPGPIGYLPEKKYVYPDFSLFEDVRLRGARLYCAARRAQQEQAGQTLSLGERVGFSVKVLGQTIDFLVVEPTLAFGRDCAEEPCDEPGPARFTGAVDGVSPADGAQAFEIPLLLGTRVTPIRGLGLPGLGEVRVPVSLVTGDTEVKTLAEKRPVHVGWTLGPGGISPEFLTMHSKEYHTVTHTDALLSTGFFGGNVYTATGELTLFYLGPVRVFGKVGLTYAVGEPGGGNDRVLKGFPTGWPPDVRDGRLYENPFQLSPPLGVRYHDGPWALGWRRGSPFLEWRVQPEGTTDPFWTAATFPVLRPHDMRALMDDDHAFDTATSMSLGLGLYGQLGIDEGPFDITLTVGGDVTGSVGQHHVLREALMAQDPLILGFLPRMRPITALTVRPRQTADVTFSGLTAKLHFHLSIPFFDDIDFDKTLFNVPGAPLYAYDTDDHLVPDDEQLFLRLGTGSAHGQPMKKPTVLSHLPLHSEFDTFTQDVDACLADDTTVPEAPPPCKPVVDSGTTPQAELCLYGPTSLLQEELLQTFLPPNVCGNVSGFVGSLGLGDLQAECIEDYLAFVCSPVSKQQTFEGEEVVARVWNLDLEMQHDLKAIVDSCATAFAGADKGKAQALVEGLVSVAACREDATLLAGKDLVELVTPGTPPPPQPAAACQ